MPSIDRPTAGECAPYFQKYLEQVSGVDACSVLSDQIDETTRLLSGLSEAQAMHRYAPGKWSVKETVVHLADAERVFTYRALRFARADRTELASFDENAWVPMSGADARAIADIVDEFRAVRVATLALARSLPAEAVTRQGTANANPMSVRAAFWIAAGHERHHLAILRERYGIGR